MEEHKYNYVARDLERRLKEEVPLASWSVYRRSRKTRIRDAWLPSEQFDIISMLTVNGNVFAFRFSVIPESVILDYAINEIKEEFVKNLSRNILAWRPET